MQSRTDSRLLRLINGQRVVDALLKVAPQSTSRADLVRATKLSKPTVSSVIEGLEKAGVVRMTQAGAPVSDIGRPAVLYELVPESAFVLGVDLGGTKIIVGIADLLGNVVAETMLETPPDAKQALAAIAEATEKLRRGLPSKVRRIRAACVGVPGIYRAEADSVEASMTLGGFAGLGVSKDLGKRLGLTVHVENDVNLAAIAEVSQGRAKGVQDFVAISIGTGIGMGLVSDGKLYRGAQSAAGEIGSLRPFGQRDGGLTVEEFASAAAIRKALRRAIERKISSTVSPMADVPKIIDGYAAGDPAAVAAIDPAVEAVAASIHSVAMLLDPSLIILGGGVGANAIFADAVARRLAATAEHMPPLMASTLGRRAAFLGAVAVALEDARQALVGQRILGAPAA